ncbi:MAG: hypothetical protein WBK55_02090 [Alphaproteobacteria bacterium]
MNKPKATVIAVLVVLIVAVGGIYVMQNHQTTFDKRQAAEEQERGRELEKRFEEFLNKFLKNIHDGMVSYKKERKMLIELVGPANLRDPAYVEENYKLVQQLIPSLRQRMADVIGIFETAQTEMDALLVGQPETTRARIVQQWDELKRMQGQAYMDFFATENDLLTAYGDLMNFYYDRRTAFEVNIDARQVIFKNPEDTAEEKRLKQRIDDLYAQQEAFSKQPQDVGRPQ